MKPSSPNQRNRRNQRNPKCSICGLDLVNGKCPAEKKYNRKNKNSYFIAKIDGVRYWTNSVFWRDFFKGVD